jgi:hypothetical protein
MLIISTFIAGLMIAVLDKLYFPAECRGELGELC